MVLGGVAERVAGMWQDRWLGLVFGMWMQGCGGISYTFGLYSAALKSRLQYNQEMTDGLGTSKDIGGNVGIVSGLLIDIIPPWAVLLIGAAMHLGGYSMLYLAANGYASPPFWQMCLVIMFGTNGATWFNTAVLVTCIRNFPGDRGVVVGLLKGFIGLSGAIFTQVYSAVYAPDTGRFLLACAVVPPLMALLAMFVIRPIPVETKPQAQGADAPRFKFLYVVCLSLAFYLMAVILIQEMFSLEAPVRKIFLGVMLVVLALPVLVPWEAAKGRTVSAATSLASIGQSPVVATLVASTDDDEKGSLLSAPGGTPERALGPSGASQELAGAVPAPKAPGPPKLGMDHTLLQAVQTSDYWLLFLAMGCGAGSGLTAINNLGQMAEALGSKSIGSFVALVSVWNFLGRMGAGYISEHYMKRHGTPRPLFMMLVQLAMACTHLLFSSGVPFLLYIGSALVGMCHGAQWTCMVAIASELFGLSNFGAMYNTLSISTTVGSYLLSVKLAGYMYDLEVERERAHLLLDGIPLASLPHKCLGPKCFRNTFLIMAGVCLIGVTALLRLTTRTRRLYQEMNKGQAGR